MILVNIVAVKAGWWLMSKALLKSHWPRLLYKVAAVLSPLYLHPCTCSLGTPFHSPQKHLVNLSLVPLHVSDGPKDLHWTKNFIKHLIVLRRNKKMSITCLYFLLINSISPRSPRTSCSMLKKKSQMSWWCTSVVLATRKAKAED